MNRFNKLLLAYALGVVSTSVSAGVASTTFIVSATVVGTCTISTTALPLGTINSPVNANIDVAGLLIASCSSGAPYTINMSAGNGTITSRKMLSGSNQLNYALYYDSARTSNWGDGTVGNLGLTGTGIGAAQSIPIYARVLSAQTPVIGLYSDIITVTITY